MYSNTLTDMMHCMTSQMATAMDNARTTLAELKGQDDDANPST